MAYYYSTCNIPESNCNKYLSYLIYFCRLIKTGKFVAHVFVLYKRKLIPLVLKYKIFLTLYLFANGNYAY